MKLLIFIPARSGSKGIKNKNLKKLNGKPLIDYTLGISKKIVKKNRNALIFVSTDSSKYLKHCRKKGVKFDYLRPRKLAGDKSNIIDAIFHGLKWLEKEKKLLFDSVLLLQPTSPLRNFKETQKFIKIFRKKHTQSLVGVSEMIGHPYNCVKIKDKSWNFLEIKKKNLFNRQQYKNKKFGYYFVDGSFYAAKIDFLKRYRTFMKEGKTKLFKLEGRRAPDIDYNIDFEITKLYSKKLNYF